jgi:hypothetical protein
MPTQKEWIDFLKKRGLYPIAMDELHWYVKDGVLLVPYIENEFIDADVYTRYRKTPNDKFKAHKKQKPAPYFLKNDTSPKGDTLIIVEGEPDAATIYGCGYSFLGVPGDNCWDSQWWKLAYGFKKVVAMLDFKAGEVFLNNLVSTKPEDITLHVTSAALLKTGALDFNDAHMKNNGDFNITTQQLNYLVDNAKQSQAVADTQEMVDKLCEMLDSVTDIEDDEGDRKALCIFHNENTPSLDFGVKGFTCFSCGMSGSIERLAAMMGITLANATRNNKARKYVVHNGSICAIKYSDAGISYEPLCNFDARIKKEIIEDDGTDQRHYFEIELTLASGECLGTKRIPTKDFASLSWVISEFGGRANIEAGSSTKDKLRSAIQQLSIEAGIDTETIYTHIGWRKINNKWVYLHGGGAIGARNITVNPEVQRLKEYTLPEESTNALPSLKLLSLAEPKIIVPLLSAVYRAPLAVLHYPTIMIWVYGETGTFKSTVAALMLNHFGGSFRYDSLTDNWYSTANAIERGISLAHDTLYIIDEYAPETTASASDNIKQKALRLIRSIGNGTYRNRLNNDATLKEGYPPRAMVISTAEQVPPEVQSGTARTFLVEFKKGCVDKKELAKCQKESYELQKAMRGYIEWLQPQMNELKIKIDQMYDFYREKLVFGNHQRTTENAIHLIVGWTMFLQFALDTETITKEQHDELLQLGIDALSTASEDEAEIVEETSPVHEFFSALKTRIITGKYYLKNRKDESINHKYRSDDFDKNAVLLGWIDEEGLYLLPGSAWELYQDYVKRTSSATWISKRMLLKLLKDQQILRYNDSEKKFTRPIWIEGKVQHLWHLQSDILDNY